MEVTVVESYFSSTVILGRQWGSQGFVTYGVFEDVGEGWTASGVLFVCLGVNRFAVSKLSCICITCPIPEM